jgi:LuxR family transcriptional regulator, maltose regulon positive regulatory protein
VSSPLVTALAPAADALPAAPRVRSGTVSRTRLVTRLTAGRDAPIATVVAPAGYGKTTLLAEWASSDHRPFSWISLADRPAGDAIRAVARALTGPPQVIVVDDAHLGATSLIRRLLLAAASLPGGRTLALASRHPVGEPLGRLRAHRLVTELGLADLAMTRLEAARLVRDAGTELGEAELAALHDATEGWPAALYLATVRRGEETGRFSGADRLVAEFLRDELLAALTREQRRFLRRTVILSQLTAPLCDAVLEIHGSAFVLDGLVRAGLPIAPLDRCAASFRCHPLLRDLLRAELGRLEPELEPRLHERAAAWYGTHDDPAAALEHAAAAGDRQTAAQLLWLLAPADLAEGRQAALGRHLSLHPAREIGRDSMLSVLAASWHLAEGRCARAELALEAAERALAERPGDDDVGAGIALLRAGIARGGVPQMAGDAARAGALAAPES